MEDLLTISQLANVYSKASISSARPSDNFNLNGFWGYARSLDLIKQVNEAINIYENANTPKQRYKSGSRLCRIVDKVKEVMERSGTPVEPYNTLWQIQFNDYLRGQRSLWGLP